MAPKDSAPPRSPPPPSLERPLGLTVELRVRIEKESMVRWEKLWHRWASTHPHDPRAPVHADFFAFLLDLYEHPARSAKDFQ